LNTPSISKLTTMFAMLTNFALRCSKRNFSINKPLVQLHNEVKAINIKNANPTNHKTHMMQLSQTNSATADFG